jgi:hypothetical protein
MCCYSLPLFTGCLLSMGKKDRIAAHRASYSLQLTAYSLQLTA